MRVFYAAYAHTSARHPNSAQMRVFYAAYAHTPARHPNSARMRTHTDTLVRHPNSARGSPCVGLLFCQLFFKCPYRAISDILFSEISVGRAREYSAENIL